MDLSLIENEFKKKVCEKIYILETTVDSSQMPSQIAGEIKLFAGDYAS